MGKITSKLGLEVLALGLFIFSLGKSVHALEESRGWGGAINPPATPRWYEIMLNIIDGIVAFVTIPFLIIFLILEIGHIYLKIKHQKRINFDILYKWVMKNLASMILIYVLTFGIVNMLVEDSLDKYAVVSEFKDTINVRNAANIVSTIGMFLEVILVALIFVSVTVFIFASIAQSIRGTSKNIRSGKSLPGDENLK